MEREADNSLVDVAAVALALHVSRCTVRRWVRAKTIPFVRTGSEPLRFDLDAVTEAVEAQRKARLNDSKYWPEKPERIVRAKRILGNAADRVLSMMDPHYSIDPKYIGFVSREELIIEGWWRSFRYASDDKLEYQFLHAVREMKVAYVKLLYERARRKTQMRTMELGSAMHTAELEDAFVCPWSGIGFEAVDLLDEIRGNPQS